MSILSGLGFRPQPDVERTLVRFHQGIEEQYEKLTENLGEIIDGKFRAV